jgi:hypothetical protein
MKKPNDSIELNCIEMKRRIQEEIARETEGMTRQERLVYWHDQVRKGPFADLLREQESPADASGRNS